MVRTLHNGIYSIQNRHVPQASQQVQMRVFPLSVSFFIVDETLLYFKEVLTFRRFLIHNEKLTMLLFSPGFPVALN